MRTQFTVKVAKAERTENRPVLVARPRKQPTDYKAFTADVLRRLPKVMAELAR